MSELSWSELHANGKSIVPIVLKVLRGEGTPDEEVFVMLKLRYETVLSIAIVNGLTSHV